MDQSDIQRILVTGAPRSGTTLLENLLNTHHAVCVLHEIALRPIRKTISCLQSALSPNRFLPETFDASDSVDHADECSSDRDKKNSRFMFELAESAELESKILRAITDHDELRVFGTKLPLASWNFEEALAIADDEACQIVFIVRNPLDVIASSMRRAQATLRKQDNWHVSNVEEACREWHRAWNVLIRMWRLHQGRIFLLAYRDLCNATEATMQNVFSFLSLTPWTEASDFDVSEVPGSYRHSSWASADYDYATTYFRNFLEVHEKGQFEALLAQRPVFYPRVPVDSLIMFASSESDSFCQRGFFSAEDWGRWAKCRARLAFSVEKIGTYIVEIGLRDVYAGGDGPSHGHMFVNHEKRCVFDATKSKIVLFEIETTGADQTIELEFLSWRHKRADQPPASDPRPLALAFESFIVRSSPQELHQD